MSAATDKPEGDTGSTPITYRTFQYFAMCVGDDAECIALLTQVMQSYPKANHVAIAAWFNEVYGHHPS